MKLSNKIIYSYATKLLNAFQDNTQKLPIKLNFYLQKNKKMLVDLATEIESEREKIIKTYGKLDEEENGYIIPAEQIEVAQKELEDLLSLEQEVNIYSLKLEDIDSNICLTSAQMEALMFMID